MAWQFTARHHRCVDLKRALRLVWVLFTNLTAVYVLYSGVRQDVLLVLRRPSEPARLIGHVRSRTSDGLVSVLVRQGLAAVLREHIGVQVYYSASCASEPERPRCQQDLQGQSLLLPASC